MWAKGGTVRRLVGATLIVSGVMLVGALVLFALGDGRWSLGESLYMAAITVSTVGFGELPGFNQVHGARTATVVMIVLGIATVAYFQSSLTTMLVEGALAHAWRKRRMERKIAELSDHIVLAGVGATGKHVVEELVASHTPFVAIDRNREHLEKVSAELAGGEMLYVHGEATDDATLVAAGVARAKGVIAALTDDRDNVFVTLSARTLNARARIVAKVIEPHTIVKMTRAGANATVSPNALGGRRLASEMVRPDVVEFLDTMLRDHERKLRFFDVKVPADSALIGQSIADLAVRAHADVMVVGMRSSGRGFQYSPPGDRVLDHGDVLVVLGEEPEVRKLEARIASAAKPRT